MNVDRLKTSSKPNRSIGRQVDRFEFSTTIIKQCQQVARFEFTMIIQFEKQCRQIDRFEFTIWLLYKNNVDRFEFTTRLYCIKNNVDRFEFTILYGYYIKTMSPGRQV